MFTSIKRIGTVISALGAMAVVSGCNMTGGGWLWSSAGAPHMATIGMKMARDDSEMSPALKGHVVYHDPAATGPGYSGVHLQGQVVGGRDGNNHAAAFIVHYQPIPASVGEGGQAVVYAADYGEPGPSAGDEVMVWCTSGVYAGYRHQAPLQGGNIKAH